MKFLGENFIAFGCEVIVLAFDWIVFCILVVHSYKFKDFISNVTNPIKIINVYMYVYCKLQMWF
jgi:hypothetical protein